MGILLVFDLTDERSFNNIRNWIHNTEQYASEGVNKILIGNKCDMNERRVIERSRAEALAAEYGIPYMETSAKARINVEESFIELAKDIKKRLIDGSAAAVNAPNASGNVKLDEASEGPMERMRGACCYGGGNGSSTASSQPQSRS